MITVDDVTKVFAGAGGEGEVHALAGVSLQLRQGELVSIVGPSGSGKSTLLFAMGGLSEPTTGEVRLGEQSVYALDASGRAALRRTEVGFVFQTFNLVPYLDCLENVALPAVLAGKRRSDARDEAAAMLSRLGLAARARHLPAQLSVGERQRVGVGRALVNAPKVLLADEPTGNLDPALADSILELLLELRSGGQTIAMVTHDPRLAARTDRVIVLDQGRIVDERRGREVAA
jgi:predicted ABC-type transport system involved in lysophospholipase L1 biosynthesis ATPase subunit